MSEALTDEELNRMVAMFPDGFGKSMATELLAARKKLAELETALNQIIGIYERNIGRQTEKLGDIPLIARRALPSIPKGD